MEACLLRAARQAGVPVPGVVAAGAPDGLLPGWLVVERLEGETIPRRILRDEEFVAARPALTDQVARALAAVHSIDPASVPGLPSADPLRQPLDLLDALHEVRPVLEMGARWLARSRPSMDESVVVHGDFRMGNFLVDGSGLRGVLDWELAHLGDPAEDIGWLCARAWRFGGPGRVGGFGRLDEFLTAYASAGGRAVDVDRVRWWEAYATVKWAVICLLQASSHLSGATRSVELAAIGRRVCESEWDLLTLMGAVMPGVPDPLVSGDETEEVRLGSLSRAEPAVRPALDRRTGGSGGRVSRRQVMASSEGTARFEARVARNVLAMVRRELALGPPHWPPTPGASWPSASPTRRLWPQRSELVGMTMISSTSGQCLAGGVRDQLLVVNPPYLEGSAKATD